MGPQSRMHFGSVKSEVRILGSESKQGIKSCRAISRLLDKSHFYEKYRVGGCWQILSFFGFGKNTDAENSCKKALNQTI